MTLILYRPGGYVVDWNDYYFFRGWAQLTDYGYFPYIDFWMEHPPLFPWLVVLAYKLSSSIPSWPDPNLAFSLVFGSILLVFEIGNLALVYLIGRRFLKPDTTIKACWIYSALFMPIFFWTAGFDAYPLFFLLLSLYFVLRGNPVLAGICSGIGFMIKLIPILVAPAALASLGNSGVKDSSRLPSSTNGVRALISKVLSRKSLLYTGCLVVTAGAIALPFVLANPDVFRASFQSMLSRTSWETIWALMDGYYSGGGVADPHTRFDLSTALKQNHTSSLPWLWITATFAVFYSFVWTRRIDWLNPSTVIAFVGLTINVFVLYSKGYSPQFLVYLLPFIVLLMPNFKGILYALLLSFINILEYPVALVVLPDSTWLLVTTVLARTGIVLSLSWEYWSIVRSTSDVLRSRIAYYPLAAVLLVGSFFVLGGVARDFSNSGLGKNPYKEVIQHLTYQPPSEILFTDINEFRQFSSFLGSRHNLRILDTPARVGDFAAVKGTVWVVSLGTGKGVSLNQSLEKRLSIESFAEEKVWFNNARLTRYASDNLAVISTQTKFGDAIELSGYGVSSSPGAGSMLHLQLNWRALTNIKDDYKVFAHLIDAQGKLVAQKDGIPGNDLQPTTTWVPGEDVIDRLSLQIPADIQSHEYSLRLGLYSTSSGNRLPVDNGNDYFLIPGLRVFTP